MSPDLSAYLAHPAFLMIAGSIVCAVLPLWLARFAALAVALIALWTAWQLTPESTMAFTAFGHTIELLNAQGSSALFATAFIGAAVIAHLAALGSGSRLQTVFSLVFAGAATGAVYAGSLLSFFVFMETAMMASVFLVWTGNSENALRSGFRYLVFHVLAGAVFFEGIVSRAPLAGIDGLAMDAVGIASPGAALLLFGLGVRAAFPLLHTWLTEAIPAAAPGARGLLLALPGTLGVYGLLVLFPGTGALVWIGAAMAVLSVALGQLASDLRRIVCYAAITQFGFLVAGIGMGSELAFSAVGFHALALVTILMLLATGLGTLTAAGTLDETQLAGLHRHMPWTAAALLIGLLALTGAPPLAGFIGQHAILMAAGETGQPHWLALTLAFAMAGVVLQIALRLPLAMLAKPAADTRLALAGGGASWPVATALLVAVVAVVLIGIGGAAVFALPEATINASFTAEAMFSRLQLLAFAALGMVLIVRTPLYTKMRTGSVQDIDTLYRHIPAMAKGFVRIFRPLDRAMRNTALLGVERFIRRSALLYGPDGWFGRTVPVSRMVAWVISVLAVFLALNFLFAA